MIRNFLHLDHCQRIILIFKRRIRIKLLSFDWKVVCLSCFVPNYPGYQWSFPIKMCNLYLYHMYLHLYMDIIEQTVDFHLNVFTFKLVSGLYFSNQDCWYILIEKMVLRFLSYLAMQDCNLHTIPSGLVAAMFSKCFMYLCWWKFFCLKLEPVKKRKIKTLIYVGLVAMQ